jgi:hypothetical protein
LRGVDAGRVSDLAIRKSAVSQRKQLRVFAIDSQQCLTDQRGLRAALDDLLRIVVREITKLR